MGYSTAQIRKNITYTNVFQHHANPETLEVLPSVICDCIYKCITSQVPIAEFLGRNLLYHGSYNIRGRNKKDPRNTLDELLWKCSELTGKYVGCPYWSVAAKTLFESELAKSVSERVASLNDAKKIADSLDKLNSPHSLRHEHVFPRNHLISILQKLGTSATKDQVKKLVERLAVGCVVLESEHSLLTRRDGDPKNPWRRYRAGKITLVDNPAWPAEHREMIIAAGLA